MRKGKVLRLKVKDIFLEEKYLKLETTKNGNSREVPLITPIQEILRKRISNKQPDNYVFTNKKGLPILY